MSEQDLSIFDALEIAKEAELKTAEYYREAAQKTRNPWGKKLFEELTEFENHHYQRLSALEDSLRSKGEYIHYEKLELKVSVVSSYLDKKEENPQSALGILSTAMEIELEAEKRYKDLAGRTNNPEGKDMFTKLASEESNHYRIVSDAYWSLSQRGVWEFPK